MRSPKTRHLHLYQKYLNLRKRFFKKNHRKAVISRMYRPTWHNFLSITIFFIKKNFFCKSEYKNLSRRINRGKTDRKRRPAFFAAYLPSPDNSWPSYGIIFILLKHRELSRLTFGYPSCWVVAVRFQFCRSEVNWPYCKLCPNSRNVFNLTLGIIPRGLPRVKVPYKRFWYPVARSLRLPAAGRFIWWVRAMLCGLHSDLTTID